jgi:hypothetical protein
VTSEEYGITSGNKGSEWEEFTDGNAAKAQPTFQYSDWQ